MVGSNFCNACFDKCQWQIYFLKYTFAKLKRYSGSALGRTLADLGFTYIQFIKCSIAFVECLLKPLRIANDVNCKVFTATYNSAGANAVGTANFFAYTKVSTCTSLCECQRCFVHTFAVIPVDGNTAAVVCNCKFHCLGIIANINSATVTMSDNFI